MKDTLSYMDVIKHNQKNFTALSAQQKKTPSAV